MLAEQRIIMGIDPGLAHTGWGIISKEGSSLQCVAYGCVITRSEDPLPLRLLKIHDQIGAVISKYRPKHLGIETVWFGQNVSAAFGTGQARGAALVACAKSDIDVLEFTPNQIKATVVGVGHADKEQVKYMVSQILSLPEPPNPDHAADALAGAICYAALEGVGRL